nr:MAG TPA: hypothetical protein [Caudoviricetes sp.]
MLTHNFSSFFKRKRLSQKLSLFCCLRTKSLTASLKSSII